MNTGFVRFFLCTLLMLSTFPSTAWAAQSITLVGDYYGNSTYTQVYEYDDGSQTIRAFVVPEHLRSLVSDNGDDAIAARKILTTYFTFTKDQKGLNGILNRTDETGTLAPRVQPDIKEQFEAENKQILDFVAEEQKRKNAEEEYIDPPTSWSELTAEPTNDEATDATNEQESDSNADKTEEKPFPLFKVIVIGMLILIVSGSGYLILKRR